MSTIAVAGATGTLGSRIVARLSSNGHTVVPMSRSAGVDLHTGRGLADALSGADVVVDASDTSPSDPDADIVATFTTAARRLAEAAHDAGVTRVVGVSILNIENPVFDDFPYYVAKREQEKALEAGAVPASIVKTTQWHEFATNPAAVTFDEHEVRVQDWLIQPVAADTVAETVVAHALDPAAPARVELTGPESIRLPELTRRLLAQRGDSRPVTDVPSEIPAPDENVLLAPDSASLMGPTVEEWLSAQQV